MTQKTFAAIVMMLIAMAAQGKRPRVIEQPEWLSSSCGKTLVVTRVEFTDTATVVSFHSEEAPGAWISFAPRSYLIGDDGKSYAARHGIGINLSKRFNMPESGQADFKISFEPMPRTTRFVDFIKAPNGYWRIWGIHERGEKLPEVKNKATEDLRQTDESTFFRSGKAVVRGRFEGKHPNTLNYHGNNAVTREDRPLVFDVADDGTFTAVIPVENPILNYLVNGKTSELYFFYVSAGDTLDMTIGADGTVTYPETAECAGLMRLMSNEQPCIGILYTAKEKYNSLPMADYAKWLCTETMHQLTVADYIAARRGLTPHEAHLLRTKTWLDCGYFINERFDVYEKEGCMDPANYGLMSLMPADDLSGLSFPLEMECLVARYENLPPILLQTSDTAQGAFAKGTDSTAIAADKIIMGTDSPSIYLQMAWLNMRSYKTDYSWDPEATLKDIDNRRQLMTSDYLRSRLDAIRERLTSPKATLRTLPEGDKGTEVFNAIIEKYRGKYVYVDFWGIYCGPCRSAIEATQQLRDSLATRDDIEIVFITSDKQSPQKQYDEYVEKNLKGEESYRIPDNDYLRLMALFGFNGIPHYELVAPDGRIIEDEDVRWMFDSPSGKTLTKFLEEHRSIIEKLRVLNYEF